MVILMLIFEDFSLIFGWNNHVICANVLMGISVIPTCENHQKTYKNVWFLQVFHMLEWRPSNESIIEIHAKNIEKKHQVRIKCETPKVIKKIDKFGSIFVKNWQKMNKNQPWTSRWPQDGSRGAQVGFRGPQTRPRRAPLALNLT